MLDAGRRTRRRCPRQARTPTLPPRHKHHAEASPTWPLSVGWEEARQEHDHDPKEQLESHVCSQGRGALWGCVYVCVGEEMHAQPPAGP